jgi:hypothetical protein
MKTFQQFLQFLEEKKKDKEPKFSKKQQKELKKGIVVKEPKDLQIDSDGTKTYNLSNSPRPVPTRPNSPERRIQTNEIERHGAKQFKK